jgi:hypothetical protein
MRPWLNLHVPAALKFPGVFGTRWVRALQATTPRPARSPQALLSGKYGSVLAVPAHSARHVNDEIRRAAVGGQ